MAAEDPFWMESSLNEDTARLGDSNLTAVESSIDVVTGSGQPTIPSNDCDSIQIEEEREEEGRLEICKEEQVYTLLGLRMDDEMAEQVAREDASSSRAGRAATAFGIPSVEGDDGASIQVDDSIPDESILVYDKDNPSMEVGTMYPSMEEFRLAMRQYAINKEFELGIEATNRTRYRGYCKGGECTWNICAHIQEDNVTVAVSKVPDFHTCTSSAKRRTTTPSSRQIRNVMMEDFVHDYYSVEIFRKAYARLIEPLPDKTKWPNVELSFQVCAPLRKRSIGRQRKNRIKGCLEGGSGGSKSGVKPAENENEKTKKMVRGRAKCKRCGELGHRQASYKCPLNGTKKRKRKPRKNTTRGWTPKDSTPDRAVNTREQIMQESPGIVTKRCLSLLMGEGTTSQEPLSSEITTTIATAPKKMTPRKAKRNLHICDV